VRAWASNTRKQEKRGKAVQAPPHRRAAPGKQARTSYEARPVNPQEGERLAFSVELRFNANGQEVGVDNVQIALSIPALRDLVNEYDGMGITFKALVVILQGETREEHDLLPGKITKKWKRFILEQAASDPGITLAIVGHAPDPLSQNVEPACLYIRSNYPRA
jgi:hypothetical protein